MTDLFSNLSTVTEGFVPSNPSVDGDPPSPVDGGPACEVCGKAIPWSGRGRKPKRCMDHKARTRETAGDDGPKTPRGTSVDKRLQARLDAVVGDLQQGLGELAGTIVPVAPVTAATLLLQGEPATIALVRIASDHPRMLDGLEAAAKAVPFVAVGKFVAAVMLAVAVDMGKLEPVGIAAEYLRVAEAAEQVGWTPAAEQQVQAASRDRGTPAPPRFKVVS